MEQIDVLTQWLSALQDSAPVRAVLAGDLYIYISLYRKGPAELREVTEIIDLPSNKSFIDEIPSLRWAVVLFF